MPQREQLERYEQLAARVSTILKEWDPLGVFSDPEWPDGEYDTYVAPICSILINSGDLPALEAKLNTIVEQDLGLSGQPERNQVFAQRIWALKPAL